MNAAEADKFQRQLLFLITELRKRRAYKNAHLNIVSTNNPRNLWYGSPKTLFRNGREVLSKLGVVENGCCDLQKAFETIQLNIDLQQPKKIVVVVWASLIDVPSPCNNATVTLPQPVPEIDLSFLVNKQTKVRFYWVHHTQLKGWLAAIRDAGLASAKVYDQETTKSVLMKRGLEL